MPGSSGFPSGREFLVRQPQLAHALGLARGVTLFRLVLVQQLTGRPAHQGGEALRQREASAEGLAELRVVAAADLFRGKQRWADAQRRYSRGGRWDRFRGVFKNAGRTTRGPGRRVERSAAPVVVTVPGFTPPREGR